MFRPALTALAFAVGLVVSLPAFADDVSDGVAKLPGAVEEVRIGGTWDSDGKSGAYRVVIARSGGNAVTARLFVQWIAYQEDGTATLENTVEIKELADLKVDIVDFTSESDADGLSVYIQTLDPNGSQDQNYELFVFSPSNYRFGPSTN
jgi:hypothetical protein